MNGSVPLSGLKKPTALKTVLRLYSQSEPCNWLVPLLMVDVDHGAGRVVVLGAVVVGFDFELLNGVGAGLHHLVGEALVAGAVGVVVDAVEHEVVEFAALAVDVVRSVAAGVGAVFEQRLGDAGNEKREVGIGAAVEGQLGNFARVDDFAAGTGVRFEQVGGVGHRYRLGDRTEFELEVDALAGVDGEIERAGFGHFEAGHFRADTVRAEALVDEEKVAAAVGLGFERGAGAHVGQRNGGAGNGLGGGVENSSENGPRFELAEAGRRG